MNICLSLVQNVNDVGQSTGDENVDDIDQWINSSIASYAFDMEQTKHLQTSGIVKQSQL